MNENTITISLDEYKELLSKAERIAAVERMSRNSVYMNDVMAVLGITKTASEKEGDNA